MKKASAGFAPRRSWRWALLCAAGSVAGSILAACGSGASDATVAPAPTRLAAVAGSASVGGATPPGTTYTVVNLDPGNSSEAFINASNQVAYTAYRDIPAVAHAGFFNGDSAREIGAAGAARSYVSGINDAGQVVGISYDAAFASVGFRWSAADGTVSLGTLGAATLDPRAINRLGQVAGQAMTPNPGGPVAGGAITTLQPFWRAFFWDSTSGARDLGTLAAGGGARGFAINDAGTVVGFSGAADGVDHAFAWSAAGGMVALGSSTGGYSRAFLINNTGQIAGELPHHGFVWRQATGMVDIGVLGGSFSGIWAMNDAGQVAGMSDLDCDGCRHAMIWSAAEGMVDLGALDSNPSSATADSFATAINRHGEVVGGAEPGSVSRNHHAFIWIKGQGMIDLNSRIPHAPAGIELTSALAISDSGAIVADSNIGLVLLLPGDHGTDAPLVGPITPDGVVSVRKPIPFAVTFSDRNSGDRHSATWSWNDGCGPDAVSKVQGPGTLHANHSFCAEGTFWVTVKLTDSSGRSTTVGREILVVGDGSAGSPTVAGSGWFMSPPGADKQARTQGGRATFSFVAGAKSEASLGASKPMLRFRLPNLAFDSTAYETLSVSGAWRATRAAARSMAPAITASR
jgi:probable HAF family extracellular repeat protein